MNWRLLRLGNLGDGIDEIKEELLDDLPLGAGVPLVHAGPGLRLEMNDVPAFQRARIKLPWLSLHRLPVARRSMQRGAGLTLPVSGSVSKGVRS